MNPKKRLLISVDTTDSAPSESQEVEIRYVEDDVHRPVEDINIFDSVFDRNHQRTSGDDDNGSDSGSVKFSVVIDTDKFSQPSNIRRHRNPRLFGATTEKEPKLSFQSSLEGVEFINSEESKVKRLARAKRFSLDSIGNSGGQEPTTEQSSPVSEVDIENLYAYFEFNAKDDRKRDRVRLDAVHLRGVDKFSTQDVFDYFGKYTPEFIEWINDTSCNAVWNNNRFAAQAILKCSRPVTLLKNARSSIDDDDAKTNVESFISPLKRLGVAEDNPAMDIEDGQLDEEDDNSALDHKENEDGTVTIDTSRHLVPPGCVWRVGTAHPSSKLILMRFATIDDAKTPNAERDSEYYKKHGNPNFGNTVGLISRSRRQRERRGRAFDAGADRSERTDFNQRRPEDLRSKLRNATRWREIRSGNRRNSDDEHSDTACYSPYSDQEDGQMKGEDEPRQAKRRPLRMQMRADDVERKLKIRRKQTDSVFGKGDLHEESSSDSNSDVEHGFDSIGNPEIAGKATTNQTLERYSSCKETEQHRKSRSRSPLNVRSRLEQYRMKITVENDTSPRLLDVDEDQ